MFEKIFFTILSISILKIYAIRFNTKNIIIYKEFIRNNFTWDDSLMQTLLNFIIESLMKKNIFFIL